VTDHLELLKLPHGGKRSLRLHNGESGAFLDGDTVLRFELLYKTWPGLIVATGSMLP
jgi:hypothetical protein